jgi:hypothetical protein
LDEKALAIQTRAYSPNAGKKRSRSRFIKENAGLNNIDKDRKERMRKIKFAGGQLMARQQKKYG